MKRILHTIADYLRECDKVLYGLAIAASLFGALAVLSTTYYVMGGAKQLIMHLLGLLIGIGGAVIITLVDYRKIMKFWFIILVPLVALVLLTFVVGYAPAGTDDKAWLLLPGGFSLQPAEFLKIGFLISFTWHLNKVADNINKPLNLILLCIHGAAPVLLIHEQGDDGTALVFAVMFVAMMFAAGVKARYFIIAICGVAIAAPLIYFLIMNEDQQARVFALLFPSEEDYLGVLWQQSRGRSALANGGFFGRGLFNGPLVQSGSIPEGYNDFIFCSIGEEFGMLGCIAVIAVICGICWRILKTGLSTTDKSGLVMCVGVFAMIGAQTLINIGMNISLLPVIGITLPFFSAGGTSLMSLFWAIGLVVNVYMHKTTGLYLRDNY